MNLTSDPPDSRRPRLPWLALLALGGAILLVVAELLWWLLVAPTAAVADAARWLLSGSLLLTLLALVLAGAALIAMARRLAHRESALQRLARFDELTGVHNRRGFLQLARHALRLARREQEALSLLLVDVDQLRQINATHGHEAGCELLRAMAGLIEQSFRDSDIIGRLGSDEFCVLALGANAQDVARRLQHLEERVRDFNQRRRQPYAIAFSAGIAQLETASSEGLERALRTAGATLQQHKHEKGSAAQRPECVF